MQRESASLANGFKAVLRTLTAPSPPGGRFFYCSVPPGFTTPDHSGSSNSGALGCRNIGVSGTTGRRGWQMRHASVHFRDSPACSPIPLARACARLASDGMNHFGGANASLKLGLQRRRYLRTFGDGLQAPIGVKVARDGESLTTISPPLSTNGLKTSWLGRAAWVRPGQHDLPKQAQVRRRVISQWRAK